MPRNAHLIEARYVGATNTKPSRIRLFSHRFERDTLTESYTSGGFDGLSKQAIETLQRLGYTIECQGEMRHGYFFVVSEFLPLRDAAAKLRASRKNGEG